MIHYVVTRFSATHCEAIPRAVEDRSLVADRSVAIPISVVDHSEAADRCAEAVRICVVPILVLSAVPIWVGPAVQTVRFSVLNVAVQNVVVPHVVQTVVAGVRTR